MRLLDNKEHLIGTGLSGLVGSRIVELLADRYQFTNISLDKGIDIRDKNQVFKTIAQSPGSIVLHLAAKTDVDGCEREKTMGKLSQAWQVNVVGSKNVADACLKYEKRMIYISTDFVFDGENGPYSEEDKPNPINFYAQTKYEGEKIVQKMENQAIICRISYPYRSYFPNKLDVVRAMLVRLQNRETIYAVSDQLIVPTFIDDIAYCLAVLIDSGKSGVYHLVGSQGISPYDLAKLIKKTFKLSGRIELTTMAEYYRKRARRPCKSVLKNDKIRSIGVELTGINEGLQQMKKQLKIE